MASTMKKRRRKRKSTKMLKKTGEKKMKMMMSGRQSDYLYGAKSTGLAPVVLASRCVRVPPLVSLGRAVSACEVRSHLATPNT